MSVYWTCILGRNNKRNVIFQPNFLEILRILLNTGPRLLLQKYSLYNSKFLLRNVLVKGKKNLTKKKNCLIKDFNILLGRCSLLFPQKPNRKQ